MLFIISALYQSYSKYLEKRRRQYNIPSLILHAHPKYIKMCGKYSNSLPLNITTNNLIISIVHNLSPFLIVLICHITGCGGTALAILNSFILMECGSVHETEQKTEQT